MTTTDTSHRTTKRRRRSKQIVVVGVLILGLLAVLVGFVVQTAREAGMATHCI